MPASFCLAAFVVEDAAGPCGEVEVERGPKVRVPPGWRPALAWRDIPSGPGISVGWPVAKQSAAASVVAWSHRVSVLPHSLATGDPASQPSGAVAAGAPRPGTCARGIARARTRQTTSHRAAPLPGMSRSNAIAAHDEVPASKCGKNGTNHLQMGWPGRLSRTVASSRPPVTARWPGTRSGGGQFVDAGSARRAASSVVSRALPTG